MNVEHPLLETIGRYLDGVATQQEVDFLQNALKQDVGLRAWYLQYAHLDSALVQAPRVEVSSPAGWSAWSRGAVAVAVIGASILFLFFWNQGNSSLPTKTPTSFATLVAARDAQWSDSNTELALLSGRLPAEMLRLVAGTAEFLLADGATVVLNGPATIEVRSPKHLYIQEGRVLCRCPTVESRITVATPATEVIDLGTEFSVEARADLSTVVAVLSGEVQVGKNENRVLRAGEAIQVRGDGMLAIKPLDRAEYADLLHASPTIGAASKGEKSLLQDPGFEQPLSSNHWNGTTGNLQHAPRAGRTGHAVRIHSDGIAHWPQCRQEINTGDITGKLVIASAWAAPDQVNLQPRQQAILKITFINAQGRDFGFALQRFLTTQSQPNRYAQAQVAAIAPLGTQRVQLQLMFQTHLRETGAVLFDDASLIIVDPQINESQTNKPLQLPTQD